MRVKPGIIKKLNNRDHDLYEICNEYNAESVFFSGKPTKEELVEVCKKEWWPLTEFGFCVSTPKEYIKKWIVVEPLHHVYTAF